MIDPSKNRDFKILVGITVLEFLEFIKGVLFQNVCLYVHGYTYLYAALDRKLLNQFPPKSQQPYQLGHYRCTHTPGFNGGR